MKRRTVTFLGILAIACGAGCGDRSLVPVEGTVTLDGQPLSGATVALELVGGAKDNRFFTAETDAAGRYAIQPFESSSTGAPPGEYRVMITSVKAPPGADEMTVLPPDPVPQDYQNGSHTLSVPTGGTTEADFAMRTR